MWPWQGLWPCQHKVSTQINPKKGCVEPPKILILNKTSKFRKEGFSSERGKRRALLHHSPRLPLHPYLPEQGRTGSSWGPRTVVYQKKKEWIVVEQTKNAINLQGCCVRLYSSLSLIMMLEPIEDKLRETFPFKWGKARPVPRWHQCKVGCTISHRFPSKYCSLRPSSIPTQTIAIF